MEWSLGQGAALLLMGWVRIAQGSSLHPEHHLDIFGMLCLCPQLDQWFKAEFTRTEVSKRHEVAFLHVEVISLHGCVCPGLTHILWPAMVHALRSITWGHVPLGCPLWKGQIALGFGAEKFVNHQRCNLAFAESACFPPPCYNPQCQWPGLLGHHSLAAPGLKLSLGMCCIPGRALSSPSLCCLASILVKIAYFIPEQSYLNTFGSCMALSE